MGLMLYEERALGEVFFLKCLQMFKLMNEQKLLGCLHSNDEPLFLGCSELFHYHHDGVSYFIVIE